MEALGQYGIRITAAALLCSILSSLCGEGRFKSLMSLLCGSFLAVTALAPLIQLDLRDLEESLYTWSVQGEHLSWDGEKMAREATATIIIQQTQAYILDKAAQLNTNLTVEVILDESNTPVQAVFRGSVSPNAKRRLIEIMESDLGITKEHQLWSG